MSTATSLASAQAQFLSASALDNPYIRQKPTLKQAQFLIDLSREAMYGGAAGGAKTSAMLIAALQFATEPNYAALILRRTFKQLSKADAIMDRAKSWLLGCGDGVQWNGDLNTFTLPSGARLEFGHIESEKDKYIYQGAEMSQAQAKRLQANDAKTL